MSKNVIAQAATLTDEQWEARLVEVEESLAIKRDAKLDETPAPAEKLDADGKPIKDATAGLLFTKQEVTGSGVAGSGESGEVVAAANQEEPSVERRQSVMGGLVRKPKVKATA